MDERIRKIADAVLFEGYILYPYRASALKNRRRFDIGVLEPNGNSFQTQIPFIGEDSEISITVRFLRISELTATKWQEAEIVELQLEKSVNGNSADDDLSKFEFAARSELDRVFGRLDVTVKTRTERVSRDLSILNLEVINDSIFQSADRDAIILHSVVGAHAILHIKKGRFVSLLEPAEEHAFVASNCVHNGVFPVLVGSRELRDTILASPVILYDFPGIATESVTDLFDGAEIDELLTLRIRTLTDAEKSEMKSLDPRARELLERVERMSEEEILVLHGRLSGACVFKKGDRVVLHPNGRADGFDLILDGKTAVVESVETDFDGKIHVAVVIDDDPGRDLGLDRMPGHRFFFSADEIEKID